MNKKYAISLLLIGFLLVGSIFLGTSYSLWQHTSVQEGTNEVKVGCFRITYTNLDSYGGEEAGDINLVNAYPVSDEAGASLTPYMFSIKNECSIAADYTVNLETLNTTTFNTDYLRVKFNNVNNVTNNTSILYAGLDNGTKILTEEASIAKLLTTGHLEYNQTDTYSLRVWVDKNATTTTSNVMGKTWNGKVAVLAEAAPTPKYTVVSGDLDTVGSVVKIADEEFYVIGQEDSKHVKLLSKWNLNVGSNPKGTATGLQDSEVVGHPTNIYDFNSSWYGAVSFSSRDYWTDDEQPGMLISFPRYVYTNRKENGEYVASIAEYVENYVNYLNKQGVVVTGRLINREELVELQCTPLNEGNIVCDQSHGGNAPEWVSQTSYWTGFGGNTFSNYKVVFYLYQGQGNSGHYSEFQGVRPVIILEK